MDCYAQLSLCQIMALGDDSIREKVVKFKSTLAAKITKANEDLAKIKYEYKTN